VTYITHVYQKCYELQSNSFMTWNCVGIKSVAVSEVCGKNEGTIFQDKVQASHVS